MKNKPSIVLLSGFLLSSGLAVPTLAISAENDVIPLQEQIIKEREKRQRDYDNKKEEYKARKEQYIKERTERQRDIENRKEGYKTREAERDSKSHDYSEDMSKAERKHHEKIQKMERKHREKVEKLERKHQKEIEKEEKKFQKKMRKENKKNKYDDD